MVSFFGTATLLSCKSRFSGGTQDRSSQSSTIYGNDLTSVTGSDQVETNIPFWLYQWLDLDAKRLAGEACTRTEAMVIALRLLQVKRGLIIAGTVCATALGLWTHLSRPPIFADSFTPENAASLIKQLEERDEETFEYDVRRKDNGSSLVGFFKELHDFFNQPSKKFKPLIIQFYATT